MWSRNHQESRIERVRVNGRLAELSFDYATGCYSFVKWFEPATEKEAGDAVRH